MKTACLLSDHAGPHGAETISSVMPRGLWPNRWRLACLCALIAAPLLSIPAWAQNQPPVADAGPDVNVYTGEWATLHGSAVDPDGDPIYSWSWEVVQMPANGSYRMLNEDTGNLMFLGCVQGDYVVMLTVSDGISFGVGIDYATVHVVTNQPPVAIARADVTNITVGATVCFDGSQSYDPEGAPLIYDWNFGDGATASTATACHSFQAPGTYTVNFAVVDIRNAADVERLTIKVFARPLVVLTANPMSCPSTVPVQFDGSQSTADAGRTLASFLWNFGDGTTSTNVAPAHQFVPGLFTVTLTVTDDLGGAGTNGLQIVAGHGTNWPPVAEAGTNRWVATNTVITLNGSATDPDSQPIVAWHWTVLSPSTNAQYSLADATDPHSAFSAQTPGTYILSLTASDGTDWSLPDTVMIWVGIDLPPVANAGPDTNTCVGVPVVLNGSAFDPDGDPIYSWSWEVVQMPANGSYRLLNEDTRNLMFLGNVQGDYVVMLTVTDGTSFGAGDDYATVHVTPPPLRVALMDPGMLLLAWPAAVTNYLLEQNPDLTTTNWTAVPDAPVLVGSEKQVIVSPTGDRFYRLHKP